MCRSRLTHSRGCPRRWREPRLTSACSTRSTRGSESRTRISSTVWCTSYSTCSSATPRVSWTRGAPRSTPSSARPPPSGRGSLRRSSPAVSARKLSTKTFSRGWRRWFSTYPTAPTPSASRRSTLRRSRTAGRTSTRPRRRPLESLQLLYYHQC